ncbi:SDR family NAD(P)-dependent oxidoreductase [Stenotrophomonas sp. GD03958]|uniref:SDR family NAD(P)-dependent oxidoreductase n=1 Tax=Stenotrophomonas sp. GD03958 TaxID=2975411 RepID=UPI0007397D8E|nr:SDR family NAD(P)-dependent oxidoreductase [Stenotrophomonas sp. GD03958]MCM2524197.1 SDR family NAD(P)-dependent oxidoreductase [Stenotrophomonas maltophilia]MCU1086593.1 SDR family NAD(P)-dependent oxidoreductase [Stenotrophomonas maltophilia]MDH1193298.1 SDR family NAD(P)-dependent oxidoreductase [Stenotrophomonas sp. GD03958]CRD48854.1 Short-chain dehydrogenase/reductase SDR [Stenotrophomonas maltophilia]
MSAWPSTSPADGALDGRPLQGRVVLVAGAGGGLGSAAAVAAAAAGATVVLLGRKPRRLDRVYAQVQAVGPEPLLYPLDLEGAGPDDYAELAQALQRELGGLDGLLVCAAHFPGLTPFELADPASFARAVHVTLTAPAWLAQACLPLLRQREDAALVFAVDAPERVGQAYWGGYGVAQHGLRGLIASLHDELGRSPVRVSGLYPGPLRTALRARAYSVDQDPAAQGPEAAAAAAVTLLSGAGAAWRGKILDASEAPPAE